MVLTTIDIFYFMPFGSLWKYNCRVYPDNLINLLFETVSLSEYGCQFQR